MEKQGEAWQPNKTKGETNMENEQQKNWIDEEIVQVKEHSTSEKFPGMKFEENKVTEIEIDFTTPFEKWYDEGNKAMKKLIPVSHLGEKKIWWLNVANPIYQEILRAGRTGQTKYRIMRTGKNKDTRYIIVQ